MATVKEVITFLQKNKVVDGMDWVRRFPEHFRESRPLFKTGGYAVIYRALAWARPTEAKTPGLATIANHSKENLHEVITALGATSLKQLASYGGPMKSLERVAGDLNELKLMLLPIGRNGTGEYTIERLSLYPPKTKDEFKLFFRGCGQYHGIVFELKADKVPMTFLKAFSTNRDSFKAALKEVINEIGEGQASYLESYIAYAEFIESSADNVNQAYWNLVKQYKEDVFEGKREILVRKIAIIGKLEEFELARRFIKFSCGVQKYNNSVLFANTDDILEIIERAGFTRDELSSEQVLEFLDSRHLSLDIIFKDYEIKLAA